MIRRVIAAAVHNWRLTVVAFLGVAVAGTIGYLTLQRLEDPEITPPYASVITIFPGAGAERVERLVTRKVERAVREIGDVRWIESTSRANVSIVFLRLENDVDIDAHWRDLRERVAAVRPQLPEGVREPLIDTKAYYDVAIVTLAVSAPGLTWADAERRLRDEATEIERRIEAMPGVSRAEVQGDREEEIAVDLDIEEMANRRVTLERIGQALAARNARIPPGAVERGGGTVFIETTGTLETQDDIARTVVDVTETGTPVRIRDIARVERRWKDAEERVYRDGSPAMLVAVYPQGAADLVELGSRLRSMAAVRAAAMPAGLALSVVTDQAERVERRVGMFVDNLWQGLLCVIAVSFLFFGLRNTLLISIAMPFSVLGAFALMRLFDIEVHQVSLAALVIALGMLVDNAIVVADNVAAHVRAGKDRVTAAIDGAAEVNRAMLSSTLTTVAAFIPLMLMQGLAGRFVASLPMVVCAALAVSYFFAVFGSPLVAARLGGGGGGGPAGRAADVMARGYRRVAGFLLRWRWIVVAGAAACLAGAAALAGTFGVEFFPKAEMQEFYVEVDGPDGATVDRTERVVRAVEEKLRREPLVAGVTSAIGRGLPRFYYNVFPAANDPAYAQIHVRVRPGSDPLEVRDLVARLNRDPIRFPDTTVAAMELEQGPPVGAPVVIRVRGDDVRALREASGRLRRLLRADPAIDRAVDDWGQDLHQVRAVVDDTQLGRAGLTHLQVAATIRAAVEGIVVTRMTESVAGPRTGAPSEEEIDVTIRAAPADRDDFSLLEDLYLDSPVARKVPLRQVARLAPEFEIGRLKRRNLERALSVKVWSDTLLPSELQGRVGSLLASYAPPSGTTIEIGGENEDRDEAFGGLGNAAIVAVAVVLLILVAQFGSYGRSLVIVTTIPFSLIGAAGGLWVTGSPIGFMSMLGLASLTGIVVNNAILLVEFVGIRRREGLGVSDAIVEAAATRLRPILATTITTVVGLIPLTLSGGGLWRPMGSVIIFGLLASMILTLVVVPCLCRIVMRDRPAAGVSLPTAQ